MNTYSPKLKLNANRILVILIVIIIVLLALSILGQYLRYFQSFADIRPWMEFALDLLNHKFYLDAETNVPTWFNSILLFIASALFLTIASWAKGNDDKFQYHWFGLSTLWIIFSVDELAVLHETLIEPMRGIFGASNWLYFAWVIPGIIFLAVLSIAYAYFIFKFDPRFKTLFVGSLLLYFSGAVGGEMTSGHFAAILGQRNFTYAVISSLEESVELMGASLLIYTLLRYIEENFGRLQIEVTHRNR